MQGRKVLNERSNFEIRLEFAGNNLLKRSNGDSALVGANDAARRSRGGTLRARNDGAVGGTLTARDGARDQSKYCPRNVRADGKGKKIVEI